METTEAKIILIRHGQSLGNAKKIYLGHTDLDLSDFGRRQASVAAEYFKNEKISAIYSSDLLRAYNTAVPFSENYGLAINKTEGLREVYLGKWEGLVISEILDKWKDEFVLEWSGKFGSMAPPDGESVFEAGKRVYDELLSIAKANEGKILATLHAAAIRAFWGYANAVEPSKWAKFVPFPTNASASFVGFDGEKLIPIRYSFDDYLQGLKAFINEA